MLNDTLTPLTEVALMRVKHDLSIDRLSRETYPVVGLSASGWTTMLRRGRATRAVEVALEVWLREEGRSRYPL